jgi:predicted membrane channel-forming protein YqfA (hemolysin III family)
MRDTGCPPFFDVLSYLICTVLSFAMIGYLLLWLSLAAPQTIPLNILVFFLVFGVMIVYCIARLGRRLFPARWPEERGPVLLREIVEIDAVVE